MEWLFIVVFLWIVSAMLYRKSSSKDKYDKLSVGYYQVRDFESTSSHCFTDSTVGYIPTYEDNIPELQPNLMFISADSKADYMRTVEWQNLKQQRLVIANYQCEVEGCTESQGLHLHHVDYIRLTQEFIEDLRLVCPYHHNLVHDKLGYDRTTKYPLECLN